MRKTCVIQLKANIYLLVCFIFNLLVFVQRCLQRTTAIFYCTNPFPNSFSCCPRPKGWVQFVSFLFFNFLLLFPSLQSPVENPQPNPFRRVDLSISSLLNRSKIQSPPRRRRWDPFFQVLPEICEVFDLDLAEMEPPHVKLELSGAEIFGNIDERNPPICLPNQPSDASLFALDIGGMHYHFCD